MRTGGFLDSDLIDRIEARMQEFGAEARSHRYGMVLEELYNLACFRIEGVHHDEGDGEDGRAFGEEGEALRLKVARKAALDEW